MGSGQIRQGSPPTARSAAARTGARYGAPGTDRVLAGSGTGGVPGVNAGLGGASAGREARYCLAALARQGAEQYFWRLGRQLSSSVPHTVHGLSGRAVGGSSAGRTACSTGSPTGCSDIWLDQLVALEHGEVAGYALFGLPKRSPRVRLAHLCVAEDHRGGHATRQDTGQLGLDDLQPAPVHLARLLLHQGRTQLRPHSAHECHGDVARPFGPSPTRGKSPPDTGNPPAAGQWWG